VTTRPHHPRMTLAAVIAVLVSAGCGSDGGTTTPTGHIAVYTWEQSAQVVADSLKYADATGTLITVLTPANGWTQTVGVPSGTAIEARVWGHSTATSQTVKIKVEWVPQGGGTILQDSSNTALAAPQTFSLTIARRVI
jgi:hypothetical protein